MMDVVKNMNGDSMFFLNDIRDAIAIDSQREVFLRCKDFRFFLEPHGEEIFVRQDDKILKKYKNFDEFLSDFKINDVLFVSLLSEIEYD